MRVVRNPLGPVNSAAERAAPGPGPAGVAGDQISESPGPSQDSLPVAESDSSQARPCATTGSCGAPRSASFILSTTSTTGTVGEAKQAATDSANLSGTDPANLKPQAGHPPTPSRSHTSTSDIIKYVDSCLVLNECEMNWVSIDTKFKFKFQV